MAGDTQTMRAATPEDARDLARLIDFAGEGLPTHFWGMIAQDGEDAFSVGVERARRETGSFSYRNARVIDCDGNVAAALVTYAIGDEPEPVDPAAMPAIFVPLQELENLALSTQYVNALAAYPDFRGLGFGTRLLDEAQRIAGGRPMSLIVSDGNPDAVRLYERQGYARAAARPIVKDGGWACEGENWLLMLR